MHIVVLGGTGFIGTPLVRTLLGAGHTVAVASRRARPSVRNGPEYVLWDGQDPAALAEICRARRPWLIFWAKISAQGVGPAVAANVFCKAAFAPGRL